MTTHSALSRSWTYQFLRSQKNRGNCHSIPRDRIPERAIAQIVNHTHKVVEKIVKDSQPPAASCERMRILSQQCTSEQVVNSVDVKQSQIIKKTVQRKNPNIHEKVNHVSKQGRTRSRASTIDKLAVVPIEMQSQDPQDSAEYEAWIRQRSDRQRSISLPNTSRFLKRSTSTKRSMCHRCYKGKFQQPKPFTENSGDALGAVHRHSRQHFR